MLKIKKILQISLLSGFVLANWLHANDKPVNIQVTLAKPKLSQSLLHSGNPIPKLTKARKNKLKNSGEEIPGIDFITTVPNRNFPLADEYLKQVNQQSQSALKDPVLQKQQALSYQSKLVPQVGFGFDGMGNILGVAPPDTNADVGPNHVVQMINSAIAIWDKQGNQLLAPVAINSLWKDFGGLCETTNRGDPIVLYDSIANRWLISQFAFNGGMTDNRECIAISQTSDPTGAYYLYDFQWSTTKFNDYPHFGVWHNGYYAGVNQFIGKDYAGAGVVAYERDKMLSGQPAQQIIIDLEKSTPDAFTPMPADIDGTHLPPNSMPQYFVSAAGAVNTLDVWTFTVDWSTPANSSFDLKKTLTVANYNGGVCTFNRNCIAQPSTQKLDAISQRMMFRLAYRNLEGTQHKLVANHTVIGSETDNNIAGVRWYEIDVDNTSGEPTIANQGTYNLNDGNSRWMASAAMDSVGNIGVAYSVSGSSTAPSIRFSGRYANDPANMLTVPETSLKEGEGSQAGANRWGDYSSLSIDPADDCTMWYTTEYYKSDNDNTLSWSTYIGSFKFQDCVAGPSGKITGVVTDASTNQAIEGAEVFVGSFKVFSDAQGKYELTLPVGTGYDISYFKYGWNQVRQTGIDLTEDQVMTRDVQLPAATAINVTGKVTDGSGLGTPLYSEIVVTVPGTTLSTFTDPATGEYQIELFGGTLVKLTTQVQDRGYINRSADIDPSVNAIKDFALLADQSCTALGYEVNGFIESFELGVPSVNWTIDDIANSGSIWQSTANVRGNLIQSSGDAAIADSDRAGAGVTTDTALYTPVLTVANLPSKTLEFDALYRQLGDSFNVEINVDNTGWKTLFKIPGDNTAAHHTVDMTTVLSGAQSFQLRWHYFDAVWKWYALFDNVKITGSQCVPSTGNFVLGYVVDANTQEPIVGAKITAGSTQVTSVVTPDNNLADGYFKLFVNSSGSQLVEIAQEKYTTQQVDIANISLTEPIALTAGRIEIAEVFETFQIARSVQRESTFTLNNTGGVAVDAEFFVSAVPVNKKMPDEINGPFHPSGRRFGPKALKELDTRKIRYLSDFTSRNMPQSKVDFVSSFPVRLLFPWGIGVNQNNSNFWVGDVKAGGAKLDQIHQYDSQGIVTEKMIDTTSISGNKTNGSTDHSAGMAYHNRTGMFWQVEVGNDNCIHEINPNNLTVTGNKICPAFAVSQRGLAYDPISDTFYSGSWNDGIIHQFQADGTILRSVNVELLVAGLALNPVSGHLFVLANDSEPAADVVVLDTNTDNLNVVTSFDYPKNIDINNDGNPDDLLPDLTQTGLAIDCDGNLWAPSRSHSHIIAITSGETNVCSWADLPWLLLTSGYNTSIDANSSAEVNMRYNAQSLEVGTYKAQLVTSSNTPYGSAKSLITMNVVEPQAGKVEFQVTTTELDEEGDASILVERVDGSDLAISVDYVTQNGTAVAGKDYTSTQGTLNWSDADATAKTITVPISSVDENKNFQIQLSNTQNGATIGAKSTTTVTIKDKPKGSGSVGFLMLVMFVLVMYSRKKIILA